MATTYLARYGNTFFSQLGAGMAALTNNSGHSIWLHRISAFPTTGVAVGNIALDWWQIVRITDASMGRLRPFYPMNTADSALSSYIEFRIGGDAIATGDVLSGQRGYGGNAESQGFKPSGSFNTISGTNTFPHSVGPEGSSFVGCRDGFNATRSGDQPIVLREGEGLALLTSSGGFPLISYVQLIVEVAATDKYYIAEGIAAGGDPTYAMSLMNRTGSGIVLNVWVLENAREPTTLGDTTSTGIDCVIGPAKCEIVLSTIAPGPTTNWSFNLPLDTLEEVPIVAFDPTNQLPDGVKAYRGPFRTLNYDTRYVNQNTNPTTSSASFATARLYRPGIFANQIMPTGHNAPGLTGRMNGGTVVLDFTDIEAEIASPGGVIVGWSGEEVLNAEGVCTIEIVFTTEPPSSPRGRPTVLQR